MKNPAMLLSSVVLFASVATAQLAPIPQPAQAQTVPCAAAPSPASATQANKSGSALVAKWKNKLNEQSARLAAQTGIPMPTTDDLAALGNIKPAPCLPKTVASLSTAVALPAAPLKLPPDASVTLRCNPMTPSPQGSARQTMLTLPDPKDFALPKANNFLADSVVPDMAAKTPCYLIKVDPKTNKPFVQQ